VKEKVGFFRFSEVNCARENCEAIVAPREHTIHRYFSCDGMAVTMRYLLPDLDAKVQALAKLAANCEIP
jgi:hypothetical protein